MLVVSDTSPILNLATVRRLDLLESLYRTLVIPPAVERELAALHLRHARFATFDALPLAAVGPLLEQLQTEAGFWIGKDLRSSVLRSVGELSP